MGYLTEKLPMRFFLVFLVVHNAHANYCCFTLLGAVMNLREAGAAHRLIGANQIKIILFHRVPL